MLIHVAVDNDLQPARFGGAQRDFGLARGLARHHRVRALCVVPNRTTAPASQTVDGVELVRVKEWTTSLAWRLDRWRVAPFFTVAGAHRRSAARYAAALGGTPDVLATGLGLSGLLGSGAARLRVYASQNVESDRFWPEATRFPSPARWRARLHSLERDAVQAAHLTVACTDEDAARFAELYGAGPERLVVIPNGFDERELAPPSAEARARARAAFGFADTDWVLAFVGGDWGPNREALAMLVDRVLPKLAAQGVKLLVIGAVGAALAGRREPWLVVSGEVDDLASALHAADAGANPVTSGGGSNVKVPAYLACGLATITTPFGLRGYAPLAPSAVVAEPEVFADAVAARPRGWAATGQPAPAALDAFAWSSLGERLGDAFAACLAGAGAAAPAATVPGQAPLARTVGGIA